MALLYVVDSALTTGPMANKETLLMNGLTLKTGTFNANGSTSGEIVTGLTKILAHGVQKGVGTITSEIKSKPNSSNVGGAVDGSIGIIACANNSTGVWMALGYI